MASVEKRCPLQVMKTVGYDYEDWSHVDPKQLLCTTTRCAWWDNEEGACGVLCLSRVMQRVFYSQERKERYNGGEGGY